MQHTDPVSVFLVDDDRLFLKSLEHHLLHTLKLNVRINSFYSAEACLQKMNESTGMIVLDYFLNNQNPAAMNGLEALKKIKSLFPQVKVIILSGQENMEVAIESIKYGAFDYVVKNDKAFVKIHHLLRNAMSTDKKKFSLKPKQMLWLAILAFVLLVIILLI
jgi:two-component system OmpR family response regulator